MGRRKQSIALAASIAIGMAGFTAYTAAQAQQPASPARPAASAGAGASVQYSAAQRQRIVGVWDAVNSHRTANKPRCSTLVTNRKLNAAAQKYSERMAATKQLSHELAGGPTQRAQKAGYTWARNGVYENLGEGYENAGAVVAGWIGSQGHNENLLECRLQEMGVGYAESSDGTPYWTLMLGTRKPWYSK